VNGQQLAVAVLSVLIAAMIAVVMAYHRGRARKATYPVLCFCAALSIWAWCDFGKFQAINVDVSRTETGPSRKKVRKNRPFHFHEFVHYYLGPKYFREVGYLGLYDCISLADKENAEEDKVAPRVSGWVRNLDDVLVDKPYAQALADCRSEQLHASPPSAGNRSRRTSASSTSSSTTARGRPSSTTRGSIHRRA
jgi:hypothetical protein